MRCQFLFAVLLLGFVACVATRSEAGGPKAPRPLPILDEEREPVSSAAIDHLLKAIRDERNSLLSEWSQLSKQGKYFHGDLNDEALKERLRKILAALDPSTNTASPKLPSSFQPPVPQPLPVPNEKSAPPKDSPKPAEAKLPTAADPLGLGQTLFRSGRYAEALLALDTIEVVGTTAEHRAPVLYLKACCQAQLGQSAKAIALLEEVVKVRGDDKLTDYARWQLEQMNWHRNVESTMQDIRNRRKAVEKGK